MTQLERAINDMKTIISRDHTEKEFKWALLHVFEGMSVELEGHPIGDDAWKSKKRMLKAALS